MSSRRERCHWQWSFLTGKKSQMRGRDDIECLECLDGYGWKNSGTNSKVERILMLWLIRVENIRFRESLIRVLEIAQILDKQIFRRFI